MGCNEIVSAAKGEIGVLDSEHEARFMEIVSAVHQSLPHWLLPQVPVTNLVANAPDLDGDERRVDFVFFHPRCSPAIVIEIDGPEHAEQVDSARDELLRQAGFEVFRVPNHEVVAGHGPALESALAVIRSATPASPDRSSLEWRAGQFSLECAWGSKLQFAVVRAIQNGMLPPTAECWRLRIESPFDSSVEAVAALLELLDSIEQLYEGHLLPGEVLVDIGTGLRTRFLRSKLGWSRQTSAARPEQSPEVVIRLEPDGSPWSSYPDHSVDMLVRPAFAPNDFAPAHAYEAQTQLSASANFETAETHLRRLLSAIFRKQEFREGQAQAIYNALRGNSSIVLLPTGGGKSIIYQLSGLLSPGITLVIDPLVSLIEDQIRGLRTYGIDRAVGISSATSGTQERNELLRGAERGEFLFILVAPERMQSPAFRKSLRAMSQVSRINLAVIDEAHCVSEWGHDFRPAYLNLARNLRRLGAYKGIRHRFWHLPERHLEPFSAT